MPRKVLFADSPQSNAQKSKSASFGHSPGPSPSWETTPQSHHSWQPATHRPANPSHAATVNVPSASTTHNRVPYQPQAQHQVPQAQPVVFHAPGAAATHASLPGPLAPQIAFLEKQTVLPVMTSSRKRATWLNGTTGSLSPTVRPLAPQNAGTSLPAPSQPHDPSWEARF